MAEDSEHSGPDDISALGDDEGRRLGRYRLIRKIGQGGMGTVFEAIQEDLDRRVAVKILPKMLVADREMIQRFRREAKAVARLNHPNIVVIYEFSQDHGFHFFSMELVEGRSLEDLLKEQGRLPVTQALGLIQQALQGLCHAWEQGIIHRDLKPANLLLARSGLLKIADFGLVKDVAAQSGMTLTGAGMGTPYYMAPEQGYAAKEVDLRADIYSLGATFYHLVTGRVPFEGSTPFEVAVKVATAPLPPVRSVNPDVPVALSTVIEKMLSRKPEGRYQNAQELLDAIRACGPGGTEDRKPILVETIVQPGRAVAAPAEVGGGLFDALGMQFALIPAGKFMMGSPKGEKGREENEGPRHQVTISRAFYLGVHEVTQEQWKSVMGTEPWNGQEYAKPGKTNAASYVSWNDATEFCKEFSQKTGKTVRLPTEAEWEYACRAGSKTRFSYGDDDDYSSLGDYAWYSMNAFHVGKKCALAVGQKKPNAWGLYDMHGNVCEWCADWCEDSYVNAEDKAPKGPASGIYRVLRGGGWNYNPMDCRSAAHGGFRPDYRNCVIGFRVSLDLK